MVRLALTETVCGVTDFPLVKCGVRFVCVCWMPYFSVPEYLLPQCATQWRL